MNYVGDIATARYLKALSLVVTTANTIVYYV